MEKETMAPPMITMMINILMSKQDGMDKVNSPSPTQVHLFACPY